MSTTSLSLWCDSIKVAEQAVVDIKEALRECQTAARQAESALDRANKKIDQTRQALEAAEKTLEHCRRETVLNNNDDVVRDCCEEIEEDSPLFLTAKVSPSMIKNVEHSSKTSQTKHPNKHRTQRVETRVRGCPDCGPDPACDDLCRFKVELFSKRDYGVEVREVFEDNLPDMPPRRDYRLEAGERWVFVSRSDRVLFRYPYTDIYSALEYVSTRRKWQMKIYKLHVDEIQMMKRGVLRDYISCVQSNGEVNILYNDRDDVFAFYYNE